MNKFTKSNVDVNEMWKSMVLSEIDKNLTGYLNKLNESFKMNRDNLANIVETQNKVILDLVNRVDALEKNINDMTADE